MKIKKKKIISKQKKRKKINRNTLNYIVYLHKNLKSRKKVRNSNACNIIDKNEAFKESENSHEKIKIKFYSFIFKFLYVLIYFLE